MVVTINTNIHYVPGTDIFYSCNLTTALKEWTPISLYLQMRDLGSERLCYMPKVTQLHSVEARI